MRNLYDVTTCSLPSRFHDVANDSNFLLTWLQCWPLFTRNSDILEGDIAIRQQEAQWLAKGLHVEVEHFVLRHNCQFFPGISRKISFYFLDQLFTSNFQLSSTFINLKSQNFLHRSIHTITTQLKNSLRKEIKRRSGHRSAVSANSEGNQKPTEVVASSGFPKSMFAFVEIGSTIGSRWRSNFERQEMFAFELIQASETAARWLIESIFEFASQIFSLFVAQIESRWNKEKTQSGMIQEV